MRRLAPIALICAALGCSGDLTEIIVVVDSNLPVPSELDAVQVIVTGSETMNATGSLADAPLPRTVGVVLDGGSLGPITVRVVGSLAGVPVIEAVASTSFLRGRTLVLPMFLGRPCAGVTCAASLTCSDGRCVTDIVDPNTLAEWSGNVPRIDGGPLCEPAPETCNGMDDDCDGIIDEDFDFRTDSNNCGRCGEMCSAVPNASAACSGSVCMIDTCNAGFDDCNMSSADGCEADLASTGTCGDCATACSFTNATALCTAGACALDACAPGFADCNMDESDGCEVDIRTLTDCGSCGNACDSTNATVACTAGACEISMCDTGFDDCNTDASDGCEVDLTTPAACGACGNACDTTNASVACNMGTCEITMCDAGFDDCSMGAADGCETDVTTLSDCGTCGTSCSIMRGTADCSTGTCEVGMCDANRGDCNTDPSDGCETNLRIEEMHCGMCGMACGAAEMCTSGVCS